MRTDQFDTFWVDPSGAGVCSDCGFSASALRPQEAVVALRTAPGCWRSALALDLADGHPDALLTQRPAGGWSAVEHAGYVRDVLHALDIRIQRVLREDCPVLPATHVTPPAGANEQGAAVVLAAQGVSVDQLAHTIEATPATAWSRPGIRAGRRLTALALVAEAVHAHQHHLRLAEAAIEMARASSKQSAQA
ncbi:MAG: DinB family protein [Actinobacteria bacterium]|nr:DinB family protein [Actinomycetota bacterium]